MSESADPGPIAGPAAPRGDEPVNLGVLDGYIYFNLRLAQGAAFRAFKGQAGVPGLRSGWFAVLSIVNDNPGITPLAVSRATRPRQVDDHSDPARPDARAADRARAHPRPTGAATRSA